MILRNIKHEKNIFLHSDNQNNKCFCLYVIEENAQRLFPIMCGINYVFFQNQLPLHENMEESKTKSSFVQFVGNTEECLQKWPQGQS